MSLFKSEDDWLNFCQYLTYRNRYILDPVSEDFLAALNDTSKKRTSTVESGKIFYRSRIGSDKGWHHHDSNKFSVGDYYFRGAISPDKMGPPPSEVSPNGRMNPNGVSYLYLAGDRETAIAEMRPWLGEEISVGEFELLKDVRLLDTSNDNTLDTNLNHNAKPRNIENLIWGRINQTLSTPVLKDEKNFKYAPTQYLAEYFKNRGFHGMIYRSSLRQGGRNYVVFDPQLCVCKNSQLFFVTKIQYEFDTVDAQTKSAWL